MTLHVFIAAPKSNVTLAKGIFTSAASHWRYSKYLKIVSKSVILESIGGKYVSYIFLTFPNSIDFVLLSVSHFLSNSLNFRKTTHVSNFDKNQEVLISRRNWHRTTFLFCVSYYLKHIFINVTFFSALS